MSSVLTNTFRGVIAKAMSNSSDHIYIGVGRREAWADDSNPPTPSDNDLTKREVLSDVICAYRVSNGNIKLGIKRWDWVADTVYNSYDPSVVNDVNGNRDYVSNGGLASPDYCVSSGRVYRCLNNNNGAQSTIAPTGTGNSNLIMDDGYEWRYITDINNDSSFNMNDFVAIELTSKSSGDISSIKIDNGGTGYETGDIVTFTPPVNGTPATGTVLAENGAVKHIIIDNMGDGYESSPTITIASSNGSGFSGEAVLSPVGGHGSDLVAELNAKVIMIYVNVSDGNNGLIVESDAINSYRQLCVLRNPSTGGSPINSSIIVGRGSIKYNSGVVQSFDDADVMFISNVSPVEHNETTSDNIKIAIEVQ